jgi:NAD+ synthase (glutamine-hydrolysing)
MSQIRIGGASLNQTPIDWTNNTVNIIDAISAAKDKKIKILCLPELCLTSYGCQDLFLSEWVMEEAIDQLHGILPYCKGISVALGLPIRYENNTYNATCLVTDGIIQGFYAKQILANEGIHYEHRWFKPWPIGEVKNIEIKGVQHQIGDLTFQAQGIKIGIEICEDAWNENRPACRLQEKGVQLILNPSASHFSFEKYRTRENLVIESSDRFKCHYLYVNQLGNESGRVIYDGDIIIAAFGQLLATQERLSFKSFELLDYDIDTTRKDYQGKKEGTQSSKYKDFAKAGALALYDYLRKSKTKGYTLSLSGGADSSSIAVLVAELVRNGINELGLNPFLESVGLDLNIDAGQPLVEQYKTVTGKILFTAYQSTKNSGEATHSSAKKLAESIGAQFLSWNIDEVVNANHDIIESAIERKLNWNKDDIALQNIQARSRSPLIWMIANINQSILLTTSNRSEGDVGYTTMDGDTSGSLAPIAGVDKPFIIEWLWYAEKELGYEGLKHVNSLTPTAELRPKEYTQTDEDDLMPYNLLLAIERLAIFKRKSPVDVFLILQKDLSIEPEQLKAHINKFFRLWSINQWKRERLAPSFHLDDFNVDPKTWCRFPILSGGYKEELKKMALI